MEGIIFLILTVLLILLSPPGKTPNYSFLKSQAEAIIQEDILKEGTEYQLSGTWHCLAYQTSGPGSRSWSGIVKITQQGSQIKISAEGYSVSGLIKADTISISINYLAARATLNGTIIDNNRINWSITAWVNGQNYTAVATFIR